MCAGAPGPVRAEVVCRDGDGGVVAGGGAVARRRRATRRWRDEAVTSDGLDGFVQSSFFILENYLKNNENLNDKNLDGKNICLRKRRNQIFKKKLTRRSHLYNI